MHGAATEDGSTGILDSEELGARRGVKTDVEGTVASVPRRVFEFQIPDRVVRVLDPEVPACGLIVGCLVEVLQLCVCGVVALVATGLDQEG